MVFMAKTEDEDKQIIFTLTLQNKESGKGKSMDIICPKGMNKPRDVAKHLKEYLPKEVGKMVKPDDVEALLNLY